MRPYWLAASAFVGACGGDGNRDTILTGFSGIVLLAVALAVIMHWAGKRRNR